MGFQVFIAPYSNPLNGRWTDAANACADWDWQSEWFDEVAFMDAEHPLVNEHTSPEFVEALADLDDDEDELFRAWVAAGRFDEATVDAGDVAAALECAQDALVMMTDTECDAARDYWNGPGWDLIQPILEAIPVELQHHFDLDGWARSEVDQLCHGKVVYRTAHGFDAAHHYYFSEV